MKILVSFGPTREYIDPVRFISNASSGLTGACLCRALSRLGADVAAVAGPVSPELLAGIKHTNVVSAAGMLDAVRRQLPSADIFVSAAAVSDYRPVSVSRRKISGSRPFLTLRLKKTTDILAGAKSVNPAVFSVGFSLATGGAAKVQAAARKKLAAKDTDMIVANGPENIGSPVKTAWIIAGGRCDLLTGKAAAFAKKLAARIISEYGKKKHEGHKRRART